MRSMWASLSPELIAVGYEAFGPERDDDIHLRVVLFLLSAHHLGPEQTRIICECGVLPQQLDSPGGVPPVILRPGVVTPADPTDEPFLAEVEKSPSRTA